ncbi:MAG: serpin family protein, partial [candidate division WOR-3 bacterium]
KFQAVSLPYAHNKMSIYLFLPDIQSDLKEFLANLTYQNFQQWLKSFVVTEGEITIPRVKLEYETSLKQTLKAMGMEIAFSEQANFTKMASTNLKGNIYIGDVKHKTYLEITEQGTEAAAVTSVQMEVKGAPTTKFSLIFNRPFFYAIVDHETNAILFTGIVGDLK